MGQDIDSTQFSERDFSLFAERLRQETGVLAHWFRDSEFSTRDWVGGFELEAWLIDAKGKVAAVNDTYLQQLQDPLVVPELARFNVELNTSPRTLAGDALRRIDADLDGLWQRCRAVAARNDWDLLSIGILPTLEEAQLTPAYMSDLKRYRALNEQVLRHREGRPLHLEINGHDHLRLSQTSVMLESAATSFQIHLKVGLNQAVRLYNAAQIASAPMVAIGANSPYLFGRALWEETRIPLFEQSVEIGGIDGAAHGPVRRVSFGSGYAQASLFECFAENLEHFPPLLPMCMDTHQDELAHLRLHNGTIWRWNRPLIGFDDDGTPHLRIEHRVIAGPTSIVDGIASTAFFFGLMHDLARREIPPELQLPFACARDNFYNAARYGLDASVQWTDDRRVRIHALVLEQLLPAARRGLEQLDMDEEDIDYYLGIVRERVRSGRTGAAWQRAQVANHADMAALTQAYRHHQATGAPVHTWPLEADR